MRSIEQTSRFKRDMKREIRGPNREILKNEFVAIVQRLANDEPLPVSLRDHPLKGEWKDFRDCHIKPDLVLIYRKTQNQLQLVRIGSHSELGL